MFHHNIPYPIKIIDYDIMRWKQPIKLTVTPFLSQGRINTETRCFGGAFFFIWQGPDKICCQSLPKGLQHIKEISYCVFYEECYMNVQLVMWG